MSSKVIIRIGEPSEQVDNEHLNRVANYTYADDLSVVFANVDVYYLILTDRSIINTILEHLDEAQRSDGTIDSSVIEKCNEYVRGLVIDYANKNFSEFTARVEKCIRTAHGVGVKRATSRVMNSLRGNGRQEKAKA